MTWKEFKEAVEAQGVKDEDEIWYIDVSEMHPEDFRIERRSYGGSENIGVVIWS